MTDAAGPLHEVVTFAVFLDYRARRMRAPVVPGHRPTPDSSTTPQKPPPPASFDSAASRRGHGEYGTRKDGLDAKLKT